MKIKNLKKIESGAFSMVAGGDTNQFFFFTWPYHDFIILSNCTVSLKVQVLNFWVFFLFWNYWSIYINELPLTICFSLSYPKHLLSHHFWNPRQVEKFTASDARKRSMFYLSLVREVGMSVIEKKNDEKKELLHVCGKVSNYNLTFGLYSLPKPLKSGKGMPYIIQFWSRFIPVNRDVARFTPL